MTQALLASTRQVLYRGLACGLRIAASFAGVLSPRVKGSCAYLAGLIDQKRYAEVDALFGHVLRKLSRRIRSTSGRRRTASGKAVVIDAATERFDAAGDIVGKEAWTYPSDDAARLVSVIIPCFNYGAYLEEAIASVRAQTISSCEIIIVDDGSTDPATHAVLDRLSSDPALRLVRQDNQGLPSARNNGIAIARGEYICCLDADDLIEPTYLECAISIFCADTSAGFVYSHVRMFGDVSDVWETGEFDIQQALFGNFTSVSAVFRRDDWREVGGYSPVMRGGFEDWEFWIRLSTLGRRGRVVHHPLFLHRRHGRTMTHDAKDRQEELQARIRTLNPQIFESTALRRRIGQVVGKPIDDAYPFAQLTSAIAEPNKPGLLVVLPWLRRGGAELLMHSVLRGCLPDWHVTIVTTEDDPHLMTDEFKTVTGEIFHLHGTIDPKDRLTFLRHLAVSRGVTHVLASSSAWFLSSLSRFKDGEMAHVRVANILHNEVPDSVFRAAVAAGSTLDRHIAVSRRTAQALLAADVPSQRISEIENGIDPDAWQGAVAQRAMTRKGLGICDADKLLIWIGRFAPEKRPEAFVDVVAALRENGGYRGLMIGEGPLEKSVDSAIAKRGLAAHVERLGHRARDEVGALVAAADMLVLTSAFEGMPLVVLEALAVGCPVAATDVGDISSVVQAGINGVLVDPAQPSALAGAVASFMSGFEGDDRRARIREQFVKGPHTLATMQALYVQMLKAL
ncbi:MAG TPA: glycosyltransferase [Bosea sp. (in: a-proteobacteria)]|jgi:glycosyltransferase involved in cell wall biosynthesis|uniref:glycosyltransferase n=1 Tax=Bosea sp. (in: a-proteobacteria) TaxID=1871050 RepID=UPI002E0D6184|nr:glycosyltransferase [Bosea sp. (in: a-proteobacteria)]